MPAIAEPSTAALTPPGERGVLGGRDIEVFYDGDCPLCKREIAMLQRMDKRGRIVFTDIAGAGFRPESLGLDMPTMMAEIHGRLPSGELITGVEVFRRLYTATGWGWLVAPTRLPGVSHLLDAAYRVFAKQRLRFTGRCGADADACRVD